ncbi:hypothetical protein A3Q56_05881 [Intoshia linei]|uniref:Sortilin N-terminal domain-containing protein n=1 Tax=Intoshia linei TaxID=1819745 RepID=A0A177AWJ7_9BILA|nr:hypothetical protein A3Q56_05881 [Intoshia linei]
MFDFHYTEKCIYSISWEYYYYSSYTTFYKTCFKKNQFVNENEMQMGVEGSEMLHNAINYEKQSKMIKLNENCYKYRYKLTHYNEMNHVLIICIDEKDGWRLVNYEQEMLQYFIKPDNHFIHAMIDSSDNLYYLNLKSKNGNSKKEKNVVSSSTKIFVDSRVNKVNWSMMFENSTNLHLSMNQMFYIKHIGRKYDLISFNYLNKVKKSILQSYFLKDFYMVYKYLIIKVQNGFMLSENGGKTYFTMYIEHFHSIRRYKFLYLGGDRLLLLTQFGDFDNQPSHVNIYVSDSSHLYYNKIISFLFRIDWIDYHVAYNNVFMLFSKSKSMGYITHNHGSDWSFIYDTNSKNCNVDVELKLRSDEDVKKLNLPNACTLRVVSPPLQLESRSDERYMTIGLIIVNAVSVPATIGDYNEFKSLNVSTYMTVDGGYTWQMLLKNTYSYQLLSSKDGTVQILATSAGVYYTHDLGNNWLFYAEIHSNYDKIMINNDKIYYINYETSIINFGNYKYEKTKYAFNELRVTHQFDVCSDTYGKENFIKFIHCINGNQYYYYKHDKSLCAVYESKRIYKNLISLNEDHSGKDTHMCNCTKYDYSCETGFYRDFKTHDCIHRKHQIIAKHVCLNSKLYSIYTQNAYEKFKNENYCSNGFKAPINEPVFIFDTCYENTNDKEDVSKPFFDLKTIFIVKWCLSFLFVFILLIIVLRIYIKCIICCCPYTKVSSGDTSKFKKSDMNLMMDDVSHLSVDLDDINKPNVVTSIQKND